MSRRRTTEVHASGGGCLATVLGFLLLWALLFGVTINGNHYGVAGCSAERGVEFHK